MLPNPQEIANNMDPDAPAQSGVIIHLVEQGKHTYINADTGEETAKPVSIKYEIQVRENVFANALGDLPGLSLSIIHI